MPGDDSWLVVRGEEQAGPFTIEQLRGHAELGDLKSDDQVWGPGFKDWQRAGDIPGLLRPPARSENLASPPIPQNTSSTPPPVPQRAAPTQAEDTGPDAELVSVIGADSERLAAQRAPRKNQYFALVSGGIFAAVACAAVVWSGAFVGSRTKQDHFDLETRETRKQVDASKVPDGIPVEAPILKVPAPVPAQRPPPFFAPSIMLEHAPPGAPSLPASPTPPLASTLEPGETIEDARRRLEADKARLEATQKRAKELKADYDKLAAERERNNARLTEMGKLIQQAEARLSHIESRLGELKAQENVQCGAVKQGHGTLVAALKEIGSSPVAGTFECREGALEIVRGTVRSARTSALPELSDQALALAQQLKDLAGVMKSIRSESERLKAETTPS
jgi:GYF domain 2